MTVPVASLEESTMSRRSEQTHGHRNHSVKSDHERTTRTHLFLWSIVQEGCVETVVKVFGRSLKFSLCKKDEMK